MAKSVSVILTVYNMEPCLRETMDSVLAQTHGDLEVVCVDDGSTDGSLDILKEYAALDDRVSVHAQENAGPALSRNRGLDLAQGDYVMLLDADDLYDREMVEKLYARATETQADIVVCRSLDYDHRTGEEAPAPWTAKAEQIPEKDPFSCADMYDFVFSAFVGWPWDKLYRRSFIEEHALRFPPLANSEDLYFVFLSLVLADRISFLDEELIKHRVNRTGSVSNSRTENPEEFYRGICLLKKRLRETPALYEKLSWGFLNWTFEHAVWNIETLPMGPERTKLAEMLASGKFAELEIDDHCPAFFTLFPDSYERYIALAAEVGLADIRDPRGRGRHPALKYPARFFAAAQKRGFGSAFASLTTWAARKRRKS